MSVPPNRTAQPAQPQVFIPPPIIKLDDTGLPALWLQDLALKILYSQGYLGGFRIAEEMALPFAGVTDQILEAFIGFWTDFWTEKSLRFLSFCA